MARPPGQLPPPDDSGPGGDRGSEVREFLVIRPMANHIDITSPSESYKNNNADEPAFHLGIALPYEEEGSCNPGISGLHGAAGPARPVTDGGPCLGPPQ
jgi:hypothetical protein